MKTYTMTIYTAHCLGCGRRVEFLAQGKQTGPLQRHREYLGDWTDNPVCTSNEAQEGTIESKQQEYGVLSI